MMRIHVRASMDEVATLAASSFCDCDILDGDDEDCCIVRMRDDVAVVLFRILSHAGIAWHTRAERGAHSDPTFAQAAQRFERVERTVRTGLVS